jgi:predicted nucleotidyltransferase
MLTHEDIFKAVKQIAMVFPIRRASYFGSYAEGKQTEDSDLDLLIEFNRPAVSLFMLSAIRGELEDMLKVPVDVIHAPIPDNSLISVGKAVRVYG